MNKLNILLISILAVFTACETVPPGHRGVEVSWGGEVNNQIVYPEGLNGGLHWVVDDMVVYDVREKTMTHKFEFNDKNNMTTVVELALDYRIDPAKVNLLHSQITDVETKIIKTLKSAGKEVVPQYSAIELNIHKRNEAEGLLSKIIQEELPEFYVEFARIQMTDVDIPKPVAQLAEETAVQLGRNELALKKEAEQIALAKAKIAKAEGEFQAAEFQAKTKDILSQPKMLLLKKLEIEQIWAEKGVSQYGNNNVFGAETAVIKGFK